MQVGGRTGEMGTSGKSVERVVIMRRRLEWFGHVKRRRKSEDIRAAMRTMIDGKRSRLR